MLDTPDSDHNINDDTRIEITDLDPPAEMGNFAWRYSRRSLVLSLRERVWMSIASIVGIVFLAAVVLMSFPHTSTPAKVASFPTYHPLSLSVVDGIAYTSSPDGTVTALRVSDGFLLWRHMGGNTREEFTTIADGVVYLATLPTDNNTFIMRIEALRSGDGSLLWSHTLAADGSIPIQLTVANRIIYVSSTIRSIDALRASDGSLLWHYNSRTPFASMPTVADGVIYASTEDGHVHALSASDGFPFWENTSLFSSNSASPTAADGRIYLDLRNGSIEALLASNGALLWHKLPPTPLAESSPAVVDGAVYVNALDGSIYALRASDGSTLWRASLHLPDVLPSIIMRDGVIFVEAQNGSVEALRSKDGSVLWLYTGAEGGAGPLTVAQNMVFLAFQTGDRASITALRASDGLALWHYTPRALPVPFPQLVADGLVLVVFPDGSIDALGASNGTLRWQQAMFS